MKNLKSAIERNNSSAINSALKGLEKSNFVSIDGKPQALLVGFTPIKNNNRIIGAVLIGYLVTDEQLQQINIDTNSKNYFAVFKSGKLIATSSFNSKCELDGKQ